MKSSLFTFIFTTIIICMIFCYVICVFYYLLWKIGNWWDRRKE